MFHVHEQEDSMLLSAFANWSTVSIKISDRLIESKVYTERGEAR